MMKKTFEFYFDYGSPYSYLADTQLNVLSQKTNSEIIYKPVLIGGIFKQTGNQPPIQNPVKEKVAYGLKDIEHWRDFYQAPFSWNPYFPVNTLLLMRVATVLYQNPAFPDFHHAAFKAVWVDKKNMSDPNEIMTLLNKSNLNGEDILKTAQEHNNKEALKQNTEAAVHFGIFGLPAFRVADELIFGNDRLVILEHFLKK